MTLSLDFAITIKAPVFEPPAGQVIARVKWDDELAEFGYKSRTQRPGWQGPDNPPAVMRYYPLRADGSLPKEGDGDFRVDLANPYNWKPTMLAWNGGSEQTFRYLTDDGLALYNQTGWSKQAYLTMCGNYLLGEFVGDLFRFVTLRPESANAAGDMTNATHPWFVQSFHCVTWDRATETTKRIYSTGTPRGKVYYGLVTREGVGYIPARQVIVEDPTELQRGAQIAV